MMYLQAMKMTKVIVNIFIGQNNETQLKQRYICGTETISCNGHGAYMFIVISVARHAVEFMGKIINMRKKKLPNAQTLLNRMVQMFKLSPCYITMYLFIENDFNKY